MRFLHYIPKAYLSWFVGHLVRLPLPAPLARLSVEIFARLYSIERSVATRPIDEYRCIGDFFTRDLKPEVRPIGAPVVCPVDGTLRSCCELDSTGQVTQVKGIEFSVADLLGADSYAERFRNGQLWNFYLSPQDAHHIHSPVDGQVVKTVHLPGALWPVNNWALSSIHGLFVVNERVVSFIESELGLFAVVMVGATNVGRIKVAYTDIETNRAPWRRTQPRHITHPERINVGRGQKIGTFNMGSSVLLVTERKIIEPLRATPLSKVRYGVALNNLA